MALTPTQLAFLGGSTGTGEMLVLFLVILILFGPRRLPEMARMLGKVMTELRRATNDFRDQVMSIEEAPPAREAQVVEEHSRPEIPGSVVREKKGAPVAEPEQADGEDGSTESAAAGKSRPPGFSQAVEPGSGSRDARPPDEARPTRGA